jgi:hypothetical protein
MGGDSRLVNAEEKALANPAVVSDSGWFDREIGWLRINHRWLCGAVLLALLLDLVAVAALSCGPTNVFHNDALLLLDDGWRVLNGQVPHRDFHTPLGPVEFLVVAAGMKLSHGSAQGIAIGIAAFGLALGVWAWLVSRNRMPPLLASLATAWTVLTATCPTPLGFDPRYLSCAMIYNRQGYAVLGIILIECAFARERNRFWGGFSSGLALALLVFLKLNFFGVAALTLLATVSLSRAALSRVWGICAGAATLALALFVYPRFSFAAFFADMSFVAHARGSSLNIAGLLHGAALCVRSGSFWLVIAMALGVVILSPPQERRHGRILTLTLLSVIVLASGPLFLQTNSLENRCQLASLWIIVLLDPVSELHLRLKANKLATLALTAACLGGIAAAFVPDVSSTLNLLSYSTSSKQASGIIIPAPGMEKMRFYDSTSFYDKVKFGDGDGAYYAEILVDGMNLLNTQTRPDETILALGFHNPFSYLLRRTPAAGGSSYLFVGNSMSENHMLPSSSVLDHADLMILPENEGTHRASDQFIQSYYGDDLLRNFDFVANSNYWELYRRKR